MADALELSMVFAQSPQRLYDDWLSSEGHSRMTGSGATIEPRVGGAHSAWDGYIRGENLELSPGSRLVQSWATTEFPEGAPPSRLEVQFNAVPGGTEVRIIHTDIPEGQGSRYETGWQDFYFEPMRALYGAIAPIKKAAKKSPAPTKKAVATKKTAPAKKAAPTKKAAATKTRAGKR